VLRGWLTEDGGMEVLDILTEAALDRDRPSFVRLAALDALSQLPKDIVLPVLQQVGAEEMGAAIPDDALAAREWLVQQERAPLSTLHAFIVHARERERQEPSPRRRHEWLVTRGAAHAVLARRGSRVALYDLRETFDAASAALPLDFITAVRTLGDADSLEPMARAWAGSESDGWWKARVAEAAADIIRRLRLSGRSAALKRLRAKHPGFL
jgi:hypothetical protein